MVQQVDPFVYPIPKKFRDDPELKGFFEYFIRWAHDMWKRTGADVDIVADTGTRETYPWLQEHNDVKDSQSLYSHQETTNNTINYSVEQEVKSLTTKTISSETYTATDNMFINATNNSTLIMPENPIRDSVIYFRKDSTSFTLRPNGKRVNGQLGDIKFYKSNLAREIWYFADVQEWFFI